MRRTVDVPALVTGLILLGFAAVLGGLIFGALPGAGGQGDRQPRAADRDDPRDMMVSSCR